MTRFGVIRARIKEICGHSLRGKELDSNKGDKEAVNLHKMWPLELYGLTPYMRGRLKMFGTVMILL